MTQRGRRVRAILSLAFLLAAIVVLPQCGGGGGGDSITPSIAPESGPDTVASVIVAARVLDQDDNPVPGVAVDVNSGERTFTTDADGAFTTSVTEADSREEPVYVKLSKGGYITGLSVFRVIPEAVDGDVYNVTLHIRRGPATADEATQAKITRGDGAVEAVEPTVTTDPDTGLSVAETTVEVGAQDRAVTFRTPVGVGDGITYNPNAPPDVTFTIGDATGAGPNASDVLGATGRITGGIVYGNPTLTGDLEIFPGEFLTQSDTGAGVAGEGVLITGGFARITLTDDAGQPITQFAPGTEARVAMRVPAGIQNPETGALVAPGDTVPIFVFDEAAGEWVVEHNSDGSVKRSTVQQDGDGMFVEFATTHLTWFNLDYSSTKCPDGTPIIHLVDLNGRPVHGAYVYAQFRGWISDHSGMYYSDLIQFYMAPKDIDFNVWAKYHGNTSEVITFRDCKETVSGNTEVELVIDTCTPTCASDAGCNDNNALTTDTCRNAGTCDAYCEHAACTPACTADSDCSDGNPETYDSCSNANTCWAVCSSLSCPVACTSGASCDDGDISTFDMCLNPKTCNAECFHDKRNGQRIAAGWAHTCVLTTEGSIKCWGSNKNRQLGNGTTTDSSIPVEIAGISNAISVSASASNTCAVMSDGTVKCWGDEMLIPGDAFDIQTAVDVSVGLWHSCVLLNDGKVKCWGDNTLGQRGDGTYLDDFANNPVEVIDISNAVQISSGWIGTCALLSDGRVKCWGNNNRWVPVDSYNDAIAVYSGLDWTCALTSNNIIKCYEGYKSFDFSDPIIGISHNGMQHICAIMSDRTVKCLGENNSGQLGDGTTTKSNVFVDVLDLTSVIDIDTGGDHTCAILSSGHVKCWGDNTYGQLGDGTTTDSLTPVDVVGF